MDEAPALWHAWPMSDARAIIDKLGLAPHPEGGWYRQTWRAPGPAGERPIATAIHFLLEQGQRSHWHRIDGTEIWLWHAGSPLTLLTAPDETGPVETRMLGGDVLAGQEPQHVIAPHHWQSAQADLGWALVSCTVAPGFQFETFTLAPPDWTPGVQKP